MDGDWQQLSGKFLVGINPLGDSPSGSLHSLFTSSIRGQTDAARTEIPTGTKTKPHFKKVIQHEEAESYIPADVTKIKLQKNS